MKAKVLNAMWKKAYNRLNRTREWATGGSNYSTFPSVHRAVSELDLQSTAAEYIRNASGASDVRTLGRDAQYDVHPLVRESTVARLLVEGRLPQSSAPISIPNQALRSRQTSESQYSDLGYPNSPASENISEMQGMELGARNETEDISAPQESDIQYLQETLMREISFLKDVGRRKACPTQVWKCDFCPYTAQTAITLLSHYQFHLQLLTSPSSRAHFEFMSAYRRGRQDGLGKNHMYFSDEKMGSSMSKGQPLVPSGNGYPQNKADNSAVKHILAFQKQRQQQLLQQKQKQETMSSSSPSSASSFLRCFVQAVMQKSEDKGEQLSSSSIYESLVNGSKSEMKSDGDSDCPAKRAKIISMGEENSNVSPETLSPLGNDTKKDIWDYPIDMSIGKCPVKQEPMELSVSGECSYNTDSVLSESRTSPCTSSSGSCSNDRLSCSSPEEFPLGLSAPDSGVFDMSSPNKGVDSEASISVQERKRTFDNTQQSNARKCNGSFAPRKMLIARSRRTHRSSSMESVSSLDSSSLMGSVPSKPISAVNSAHTSEPCSDVEPSSTPLPYPVQNTLALDMSTQCSLLLPIDSIPENDSDNSRASSPAQGVLNPRELGPAHTQCTYCGIQFGDEVLHSIHMGCHNHTEPFVCNICGKDCSNKYGFYTHIMRGHSS